METIFSRLNNQAIQHLKPSFKPHMANKTHIPFFRHDKTTSILRICDKHMSTSTQPHNAKGVESRVNEAIDAHTVSHCLNTYRPLSANGLSDSCQICSSLLHMPSTLIAFTKESCVEKNGSRSKAALAQVPLSENTASLTVMITIWLFLKSLLRITGFITSFIASKVCLLVWVTLRFRINSALSISVGWFHTC
eukprot:381352_1